MPSLKHLSPSEYAILRSIAEAVVPRGGAFELGSEDAGVADTLDGLLHYFSPEIRRAIRGMIRTIQILPFFFLTFSRFTALSVERRADFLHRWEESGFFLLRGQILAVKVLVCMVFYSDPRVEKILGYSPECEK